MENTIGYRIQKLRKEKKLPQKFVADLLGLHRANYSKVESNTQNLTPVQIKIFCEYFNVSSDYLLDIQVDQKIVYDLDTIEEATIKIKEFTELLNLKK